MQQVRSLENNLLAKKFKELTYYLKNLRSNRYKRKTYRHCSPCTPMGARPAYIYINVDVTVNSDVNHHEFKAQY
jgi:hypothetical protein